MVIIDMSQVAGFKAVDAEGNELGVVSMNELTESISEQVLQTIAMRNQATTLEHPALMSAASTLAAGNDAYENELTEQTDLKWARALDASGNPILISKESLASVVGGLMKDKGLYPYMNRGEYKGNILDISKSGYYMYSTPLENKPNGFSSYGFIEYAYQDTFAVVKLWDSIYNKVAYRIKTNLGWGNEWIIIN